MSDRSQTRRQRLAIESRGPGVFIAGGAGITPFIAILRQLHQQNKLDGNRLFFSNRKSDSVLRDVRYSFFPSAGNREISFI